MSTAQTFASVRHARSATRFAMQPPQIHRVASTVNGKTTEITGKFKPEEWQKEAYGHVEAIGELGYVINLMGTTLAKGRLVVAEHDEFGRVIEPDKGDEGETVFEGDRAKAERALANLKGPDGDHKALLSFAGQHDQVAGEAILLGEPIPDDGGVSWEVVSVLEVQRDSTGSQSKKLIRKRSATGNTVLSVADDTASSSVLSDDTYLARYLRKSLAFSGDATSTLYRNKTVCREIVLLDQLKDTLIKSRLAAGIMLIPEEVTFPSDDDLDDVDTFLELVVEHVSAPVQDRTSAAGLAPLVVRVPAEFIEKWRLFALTDGKLDLSGVQEARLDALRRLAAGIDLPLERMEGIGGTNHWNFAGIEADEVRKHIIPLGERIARFFTVSYLHKVLVEFEDMSEEDVARFSLVYDASEILTRMDTASSADTLHGEGLISDEARIRAHGFDPDEVRPTEEERARRLVERLAVVPHANNRVLVAGLLDPELVGIPADVWDEWLTIPATTEALLGEGDETPPPADQPVASSPAAGEPGVDRELNDQATMAVLERVRTHGHMTLTRALEKAANQVLTQERKLPPDTRSRVEQIPRSGPRKPEVLHMLAPSDWGVIDRTPEKLLDGAFDEFETQTVVWVRDMLTGWGEPADEAHRKARRVTAALSAELNGLAVAAFQRPLGRDHVTGMTVPLSLVVDTVGAGLRQ